MRLFVGSLSIETSTEDVEEAFEKYGTVTSCRIMTTNGVHRGFGFVEMPKQEEAKAAIAAMDGRVAIKGKIIRVADADARPRGESPLGSESPE